MKYLKRFTESIEISDDIRKNISDMLLELSDDGFEIQITPYYNEHIKDTWERIKKRDIESITLRIHLEKPIEGFNDRFSVLLPDIQETFDTIEQYLKSESSKYEMMFDLSGVKGLISYDKLKSMFSQKENRATGELYYPPMYYSIFVKIFIKL